MENLRNESSGIINALEEDLERLNFIAWYSAATPEDLELARQNNAEKLDELIVKYKHNLELNCLVYGR
ncbi:hypothetical protein BIY37_04675 [Candidatus Brocadia sapporoensis]|uniref:Uncharacterized protein n=1 Tax=Candidatus Brocadia sapporoensis TaxID=392547 RepID=A0A1V6M140_9BACT|nr:hypothetical protein [Candidatus Brocadia sapporoensis]MDG6005527.1 hypothetical protein [Candidatus Brocadia sp.]OQD46118.1 hypothetical protein BIY37_04675 [Candidatus Brocadia sapporoensis]GJQ23594.1 MAG: hypothetical protein HBSAPP01_13840 [Candidatus Brocadia sapporoensis]